MVCNGVSVMGCTVVLCSARYVGKAEAVVVVLVEGGGRRGARVCDVGSNGVSAVNVSFPLTSYPGVCQGL